MLLLRSSCVMMFCYSSVLLSKSLTILLNTCVNGLCALMEFWVPVLRELTAEILLSLYSVDCSFCFQFAI